MNDKNNKAQNKVKQAASKLMSEAKVNLGDAVGLNKRELYKEATISAWIAAEKVLTAVNILKGVTNADAAFKDRWPIELPSLIEQIIVIDPTHFVGDFSNDAVNLEGIFKQITSNKVATSTQASDACDIGKRIVLEVEKHIYKTII